MIILAIETCTTAGSVAVVQNPGSPTEQLLYSQFWQRSRSHAEVLTPTLAEAMETLGRMRTKAGKPGGWSSVDAVAVGVGPYSFTGIRVGLNAARAAAWSLNLPVIPIRSTDALIEGARSTGLMKKDQTIVAVLPAQMGLVFAAWGAEPPQGFEIPVLIEKLKALRSTIVLIGEGRALIEGDVKTAGIKTAPLPGDLDYPLAATVARLAAQEIQKKTDGTHSSLVQHFNWRLAQPLYIRGSGAEEKRR